MTVLGLHTTPPGNEIRVSLSSRMLGKVVRVAGGLIPGAAVAVVLGVFTLLKEQPKDGFGLLRQWGVGWVIALAGGYWAWTIAMRALDYLGRLASGVQDSAVAIARLADKDDRERDRMITETSYIGAEMKKITSSLGELKEQNARIELSLRAKNGEG